MRRGAPHIRASPGEGEGPSPSSDPDSSLPWERVSGMRETPS